MAGPQVVMRLHWPFAVLAAVGLILIFVNLGSDYLWEDEGDTAVLASNIVKYGIPKAWDGVTFTDSDKGARVNDNLVMVSHPWLQYYLTAASFLVFGENAFAARLPFAFAGWLTIVLVYIFLYRVTASRVAAFGAAALIVLSVQFLLYARQCRNYSLNMLLTCGLIFAFFRMKSARSCALFAALAILLFHTYPLGIVPVAVLGGLTLIYHPFRSQRRWFWRAAPVILVLTLPWLAMARGGYAENTHLARTAGQFFGRFTQYLIECASVTPLLGSLVLLALCLIRRRSVTKSARQNPGPPPAKPERDLLVITLALLFSYALAIALTQSSRDLWFLGIRYTTAIIPLVMMVVGLLIWRISRERIAIWLPILLLFGFTKLAYLTPWVCWEDKRPPSLNKSEFVAAHVPAKPIDCFLPHEQLLFIRDLWRQNPGTVAKICEFLQKDAKSGDVLITNYSWEPLYFYTHLPQGLKILPNYPIYEAARLKRLPEYVFGIDHVRWIIWRGCWDGYLDYRAADIARRILAEGARVARAAEIEETWWENRENIHFHRFSGGKYLFPWPKMPPAQIFRVDWPDHQKNASSSSTQRTR